MFRAKQQIKRTLTFYTIQINEKQRSKLHNKSFTVKIMSRTRFKLEEPLILYCTVCTICLAVQSFLSFELDLDFDREAERDFSRDFDLLGDLP